MAQSFARVTINEMLPRKEIRIAKKQRKIRLSSRRCIAGT
jgi:hypothetical protein